MKDDNTQGNHRGSSPPFQDPERDFYDWLKGLRPIGQRDEKVSVNQIARRLGFEKTTFTDPNFGGAGQGRDDESRWREDGGEGGEVA
jgi:hypothetical protein